MAAWFMKGYRKPWFFAGGWAIDLFLGRRRRWHKDVDLAVFRSDQAALQGLLADRDLRRVKAGQYRHWRNGESLFPDEFQAFARPWVSHELEWEYLFENGDLDRWIYRRNPEIWLPGEEAYLKAADGTPYLAPEVVLLFKSKPHSERVTDSVVEQLGRMNDEEDFQEAWGALSEKSRKWLAWALETEAACC